MTKLYWILGKSFLILLCFLATHAWSQTRPVTGRVTSSDDASPLPGVNILIKNSTKGTVTDAEGNFSVEVKQDETLVFSFVGYASQEVTIGSQTTLSITLSPDLSTLSEVVVIGYGEVKKSDATGSVVAVDSRAFNKGVVNSPQELLMGKTAGVSVTTNSGAPGNASTIRIRGGSSLGASNDPLIVIDGVPVSNDVPGGAPNILSTINPNDIETFTVLKDASATAIYGVRASNGVIIITTKRGGNEFKVNYTATATVATAPRKVSVYSGDEFRALINQQYGGNTAVTSLLGDANTDWQKEIYHEAAFGQDHNVTVSGTKFNTPIRVSLGYNNTDGILKTYNFQRTTLAIGADPTLLNGSLKVNINVKGMYNTNNFADQAAVGNAIAYDPTKPVYNGNTRWRGYTTWTTGGIDGNSINLAPGNPVARLALTDNTSTVKRSIGNIKFDYAIPFLKALHANLNLAYDYTSSRGHNNVADNTQWIYLPTTAGGQVNPYQSTYKNQLLDFYLNYSKNLESIHSKIDVMGGYSWQHFYKQSGDSTMNQLREGTTRVNVVESERYLVSFFGRLNYAFHDKYLLTATLRDDGTSVFNPNVRWGLFPAVGLGWKINQENFLKNSKVISDLKLRLGYGTTGQQAVDSDYPYIATYTISDNAARYPFGSTYYNTLRPDGYNQNLKWETTTTINAGFDFGFLKNRITGSVDVYEKKSTDLLSFIPPASGTNFTGSLISNIGNLTNRGVELNLSGEIASTDDFQWTLGYNITYNQNKITKLTLNDDPNFYVPLGAIGGTTSGTIQAQKVGYPRTSFLVYQQVYDANGKPVQDAYVDRNGDGVINTSDMYIYKKPDPSVYMGINSRMNYKKWDFSFSGRANLDNYVYNNVAANSTYNLYNSMQYLTNTSKQADDTKFSPAINNATNTRFSDYYIQNASFFRLDNVNFGYSFKNLCKEKLKLRVGVGVQNVFVITKYKGIDPEISGGLDNNFFPRTRSFFLNLNAQF